MQLVRPIRLIRYDEIDQSDIRYLLTQGAVDIADVEAAVTGFRFRLRSIRWCGRTFII